MSKIIRITLATMLAVATAQAASPLLAATPTKPLHAKPPELSLQAVNNATLPDASKGGSVSRAALLRAQILLARANFSPGEFDTMSGSTLRKALLAYQGRNQLNASGKLDLETWNALNQDTAPALAEYTITATDVAGPFVQIPTDMVEKAKLPVMGYASPAEAFAERFHASPKLLQQLNPRKNFGREGEVIVVPNVAEVMTVQKPEKGGRVIVSKSASTVTLVDSTGNVIAHFPASVGSEHDPLPLGNWKINGVARNPKFHYNPKLFWDADPDEIAAKIPPGPNNPVGVVWIDLSKPHYGIHGTSEPSTIGKTQSHGCIRMTNWDAAALAQAVYPGMVAVLQE